jgi:hypothetical protein
MVNVGVRAVEAQHEHCGCWTSMSQRSRAPLLSKYPDAGAGRNITRMTIRPLGQVQIRHQSVAARAYFGGVVTCPLATSCCRATATTISARRSGLRRAGRAEADATGRCLAATRSRRSKPGPPGNAPGLHRADPDGRSPQPGLRQTTPAPTGPTGRSRCREETGDRVRCVGILVLAHLVPLALVRLGRVRRHDRSPFGMFACRCLRA